MISAICHRGLAAGLAGSFYLNWKTLDSFER